MFLRLSLKFYTIYFYRYGKNYEIRKSNYTYIMKYLVIKSPLNTNLTLVPKLQPQNYV